MKKTLLLLSLLIPPCLHAQTTEGTVNFTETVKMKIQLPDGPEGDEMRKMIPPTQSFTQVLYFSGNASLYREPEGKEGGDDREFKHEKDGMDVNIVMKHPENRIYRDLEKGDVVESQEFFGRFFLIKGDQAKLNWKLTGEQKKVLDFVCQKAVLQDTSKKVEVWFAPQIPVSSGPGSYSGLPGLILAVDMNHGDRIVTADKITLGPLPKDALTKPNKGKAVTREEFNKIKDEKMKEMGAEGGPGGTMRVIIRN
jgi:GLPGLI family protein